MQRIRTHRRSVMPSGTKRLLRIPLPTILAALVLVFAGCSVANEVDFTAQQQPVDGSPQTTEVADSGEMVDDATAGAEDSVGPVGDVTDGEASSGLVQVLVVREKIAKGTSVRVLLDSPVTWLSPEAVPSDIALPSAIGTVAELQEMDGTFATRDLLPGEQLDRQAFADTGDFTTAADIAGSGIEDADGCLFNKVVDTDFAVDSAQVLVLREDVPAGFPISALLDAPEDYLTAQRIGTDQLCAGAISQMATLNDMVDQQTLVEIPAGAAIHKSQFG